MAKKIILGLLFCAVFCIPTVWATAIISGVLKNALPNDRVEVFVPHYYVDGRSDTYRSILSANSEFYLQIEVPEPQLVFLVHNEDRLPLFIEPNDSLHISSDLFQFPLVVSYSGGTAAINNQLTQEYLRVFPQDFNEFNNVRFKIGQTWISLEVQANAKMEENQPDAYLPSLEKQQRDAFALIDDFEQRYPNQATNACREWLVSDAFYKRAYHLLVYGSVYKNRYKLEDDFFEFLDAIPTNSDWVSNEWYRQFIGAYMARLQSKDDPAVPYFSGQYYRATQLFTGKSFAYMGSEIIRLGFSAERYQEILPCYTQFLQSNPLTGYDQKITPLYEKSVRISPGILAPTFTGKNVHGENVSLGQFRGKVVYLNFWATWCGSCIKKMEVFNGFAEDLSAQGIEIVNISIDANAAQWRNSLVERSFKGQNMLASEGFEHNIAKTFGVEAVPQYFIIDKYGAFASKPYANQPDDIRQKLIELSGGGKKQ
jgi:thiol-disulfide isomerase/thioredoxin